MLNFLFQNHIKGIFRLLGGSSCSSELILVCICMKDHNNLNQPFEHQHIQTLAMLKAAFSAAISIKCIHPQIIVHCPNSTAPWELMPKCLHQLDRYNKMDELDQWLLALCCLATCFLLPSKIDLWPEHHLFYFRMPKASDKRVDLVCSSWFCPIQCECVYRSTLSLQHLNEIKTLIQTRMEGKSIMF